MIPQKLTVRDVTFPGENMMRARNGLEMSKVDIWEKLKNILIVELLTKSDGTKLCWKTQIYVNVIWTEVHQHGVAGGHDCRRLCRSTILSKNWTGSGRTVTNFYEVVDTVIIIFHWEGKELKTDMVSIRYWDGPKAVLIVGILVWIVGTVKRSVGTIQRMVTHSWGDRQCKET